MQLRIDDFSASRAGGGLVLLVWPLLTIGSIGVSRAEGIDEFHAYILPDTSIVAIDSTFTVSFAVDSTARDFNAFRVTIQFDPEQLSLVNVEPGALMLECGPNPWFLDDQMSDSTVTIESSLLCSGETIEGPGDLTVLTFHAEAPDSSTIAIVSNPDQTFLDAGLWIWPGHENPRQVIFHDGLVIVFDPVTAIPESGESGFQPAPFAPNPTRSGGWITLPREASGDLVSVLITSVTGRMVWRGQVSSELGRVRWPEREISGEAIVPGVYFYTVIGDGFRARGRVVRIR